jgi:hypothetical protein
MTVADFLNIDITPRRIVFTLIWLWACIAIWKALRPEIMTSMYAARRVRVYAKLRARCFEITSVLLGLAAAFSLVALEREMASVRTLDDLGLLAQDAEVLQILGCILLIGFTILVITSINEHLDRITLHTTGSLTRGSAFALAGLASAGFIALQIAEAPSGLFA